MKKNLNHQPINASIIIKAQSPLIRTSPRKIRLVVDAIRHIADPTEAIIRLKFMEKRAAQVVEKTLRQAIGNATNNLKFPINQLLLNSLEVNAGPTMKRFRIGGRGRTKPVLKRTSRLTITLKSIEKKEEKHGTKNPSHRL